MDYKAVVEKYKIYGTDESKHNAHRMPGTPHAQLVELYEALQYAALRVDEDLREALEFAVQKLSELEATLREMRADIRVVKATTIVRLDKWDVRDGHE